MAEAPVATRREPAKQTAAIVQARLPFQPIVFEAFGINQGSWKALVEAIFPSAQSTESVILALSYCRARKLDPFKRNVHIVPIWSNEKKCMVDTIWPGIGELRTTAFRTGEYAGIDDMNYGPDITEKVGNVTMTYPEWAQVTVHRMVKGVRVAFAGPRVYWIETYATAGRNDDSPNSMWQNRPRGQLGKCSEAAALRAAFPEEVGTDYIPEEVQHAPKHVESAEVATTSNLSALKDRVAKAKSPKPAEPEPPRADEFPPPDMEANYDAPDESPSDDANQDTAGALAAFEAALKKAEPMSPGNRNAYCKILFDGNPAAATAPIGRLVRGIEVLRVVNANYEKEGRGSVPERLEIVQAACNEYDAAN